jgi:LacI family transcriptional regulator
MSSINDVARLAGVSAATVSRVMSGSSYPVRRETRERVVEAADQLGFRPNQLARGLATSRTNIVAAIVHDISDPYFAEVVRALGDAATEHGYQLLASSSDRDPARELEWLEILLSYRVDGVVFASSVIEDRAFQTRLRQLVEQYRSEGRAVVRLASHLSTIKGATVDQRQAARGMARHLLRLGHRRIGLITGPPRLRAAAQRREGFHAALEEAGIEVDPELEEEGSFTSDGGAVAVTRLLCRVPDVTAVFATNDAMAIGALRPLIDAKIRVPQDLSLAGFNDVKIGRYVSPSLTTVHVPIREQAMAAFELLLDGVNGREQRSRRMETHIVERQSTAGPRRRDLSAAALDRLRRDAEDAGIAARAVDPA